MLILTNDDIEPLLHMPDCVAALEEAYRDLGNGEAVDIPRQDMLVRNGRPGAVHGLKTMSGSWPRAGVAALRLNSDVVTWPTVGGHRRRVKVPLSEPGGRYNGSVLLFSIETGQLLCILNDGVMQKTRVGGSSGVAAKYLSREDSRVMGLLGTGWQAEAQLEAMCAVRRFDLVKVFSPSPENRRRFVERFRERLQRDIRAVDSPDEAAQDADVLVSATNSMAPTIRPEWIRPGMHITSVRGSEIPVSVLEKVDRLVVNMQEPVSAYAVRGLEADVPEFENGDYSRPDAATIRYDGIPELKDVVAGLAPSRQAAGEVTCFHNYKGLGLQFAAVAGIAYRRAREQGLGLTVEDRYFTQTVHP